MAANRLYLCLHFFDGKSTTAFIEFDTAKGMSRSVSGVLTPEECRVVDAFASLLKRRSKNYAPTPEIEAVADAQGTYPDPALREKGHEEGTGGVR